MTTPMSTTRRPGRGLAVLFSCVLAVAAAAGCGSDPADDSPASDTASPDTTARPADTTPSTASFDPAAPDGPYPLDTALAADSLTCEPPDGDSVRCTTIIENTFDRSGHIVTDVAFYDASDVRVETDSRFETYVASGQRYLDEFFGPATTIRAEVLAVTWEFPEEPVTGQPVPDQYGDGVYLPVDRAVRDVACRPDSFGDGGLECDIEIENLSDATAEIDTTVAFFDADGLRVSTDSRFQEAVAAGEVFRQTFFGDPGATTAEVYEVLVAGG